LDGYIYKDLDVSLAAAAAAAAASPYCIRINLYITRDVQGVSPFSPMLQGQKKKSKKKSQLPMFRNIGDTVCNV